MLPDARRFLARQTPSSLLVIALMLYAAALSVVELVAAVDFRMLSGTALHAGATADPLYEAGTSLGFYGALFFLLNFLLATRWRWIERLFGGLDRVYALHALTGQITLAFVLLHTVLLVLQALPDWSLVGQYIVPGLDLAYTLGVVGSFGALFLVALTLWVKMPYEAWLNTHKLMIIPFLGGTLHAVVLQLDWYMVLITVVGTIAWAYATFAYPSFGRGAGAVVTGATTRTNIRELTLAPERDLRATPGQFVFLSTPGADGRPSARHPFSLSSLGTDGQLRLSIRQIGDFTLGLERLRPGQKVRLHGPYGSFGNRVLAARGSQVWIAGGIGVTPFLSILETMSAKGATRPLRFVWSVREAGDAVYAEEISRLMATLPNARFDLFASRERGRLSADMLLPDDDETTYCLCGPSDMMVSLERQLVAAGVSPRRIISEHFAMR